jgi:hypothetical protein
MSFNITVGKYRIEAIESVEVVKNIANLADTAVITLPQFRQNKAIDFGDKIAEGDPVTVELGYNRSLTTEFKGYLKSISANSGSLTLECEDELYLFNKPLKDAEYKNITLKSLLEKVVAQTDPKIRVECDFEFGYDKFTFFKATGQDVLKTVQDESKADIYFRDGTLHVHAPYFKVANQKTVKYDFGKNVESADLKYLTARQKNIEVEVIYTDAKGKRKSQKFGKQGGAKETIVVRSATEASAQKAAQNAHARLSFDGYEGSITGWLIPFVEPACVVRLHDSAYPHRDGDYFVTSVETKFSQAGGVRSVKIGKKTGD